MPKNRKNLPIGNESSPGAVIRTAADLGLYVSAHRKALRLNQLEIAGMANTGNRFIVELESGKKTIQLQKALDVIDLLGLEVVVRPKSSGGVK